MLLRILQKFNSFVQKLSGPDGLIAFICIMSILFIVAMAVFNGYIYSIIRFCATAARI